jgi:hypothetical protein
MKELDRHRGYFAKLSQWMRARKWYIDSAVLNAVEAACQASAAAINAIRAETKETPKEVNARFELTPPTKVDHPR